MAGNSRWRALKKTLEARSGHDFERALFPLLKIRWPELVHPKSLKYLDNSGIDQVLVVDGNPHLKVVVQCKGFEVIEPLADSQIAQFDKSVDRFEASGFRTDEYVLIYNRFGTDRDFESASEIRLKRLVSSGYASKAEVWNLNTLASELSDDLLEHMLRALALKASQKHTAERQRFKFGEVTVADVPYSLGSMQLGTGKLPSIQRDGNVSIDDPIDAITTDKRSVSLVIGTFGSGKSTLGYRLSEQPERRLIYVPASALTHSANGTQSENSLAQSIVEYLELFDDSNGLTDEHREYLSHLAGPLLSSKFRSPDSGLMLLIDAIDENRFYSSARGFQTLTNELARAHCPIIITTRLEHFVDSFEAFDGALSGRSPFGVRNIRLITLHAWTGQQVREYLNAAIQTAEQASDIAVKERLASFLGDIVTGKYLGLALHHPLFLAMSADLVASGDATIYTDKFELYENWAQQKLWRDFSVERSVPQGYENTRILVSTIMELMSLVGAKMHGLIDTDEPSESIEESTVRAMAANAFGVPVSTDLYSTTTLLIPHRTRATENLKFQFFHKSFQDYFGARWLRDQKSKREDIPRGILDFISGN